MLGYESLSLGAEYQLTSLDLPMSLTADARFGEDGAITAMSGLRFHVGGEPKSLIHRHREDLVRDRGFDLFAAAGDQLVERHPVPADYTDSASSETAGFTWFSTFPEHCG